MKQSHRLFAAFTLMCAVLACGAALGANQAVVAPGPWKLYEGSRIVGDNFATPEACAAAASQRTPRYYTCRAINGVTVMAVVTPPDPVPPREWVLSGWSAWQTTMTSACVSGSQSVSQARTRTVLTLGDGQQPLLSESRTLSQSCVTPPPSAHIPAAPSGIAHKTLRIRQSPFTQGASGDGTGNFRIRVPYSHMGFDDPIVFPGQPGRAHLHTFFGNTSTNANSTTESLAAAPSTASGGIANRSAYWIPAFIDTVTSRALIPDNPIWYYKTGYNNNPIDQIIAPPRGLRLIAGKNPAATGPLAGWEYDRQLEFWCEGPGVHTASTEYIPACAPGHYVYLSLDFPECWDGENLDSTDHRSHLRYSASFSGDRCQGSHPVALPVVTLTMRFQVPAGSNGSLIRLSSDMYPTSVPGGYSMHADVWYAWDESIMTTIRDNCWRRRLDCGVDPIGDGRELY